MAMGRQSPNELPLFAGTAAFCGALRDGGTLITALPLLLSVRACMRVRVCVSPSTPAHELAPVQAQEVNILPAALNEVLCIAFQALGREGGVFFGVGAHRTSVQVEAENTLAARHQEATACSSSSLPFAGGAATSSTSPVVVASAVPAFFFPLASPTCLCVTGACCCDLQPRNNQQPQLGFLYPCRLPFSCSWRANSRAFALGAALLFGRVDRFVRSRLLCVRAGLLWWWWLVWVCCLEEFLK